ncbi:MAG: hypothetical protein Q8916_11205 [Bacteroidota bacterium]|nr:hypothetical protein [Bacteroidota bacterium]MDP4230958.1 hypothetical protein [Bacteroidota bacterium]MDP4235163.1 hypothetical protein [Bacteroidota bacterium]
MKQLLLASKNTYALLRSVLLAALLVAVSSLAISTFNGCSSGPTGPDQAGTQVTTIYGRITDETGAPLMGVTATAGGQTATTDANGLYIIKNATVPKGRAVVIAKKAGYFNAAKAELPTSGSTRIELAMMTDVATSSLSCVAGGTVNVAGGAAITFAGGSFTDASGAPYTGTAKISARFLDPKNPSFFDYFSGDDMALSSGNKYVSLISSGVLRVELKDPSGQTLKLDPTKPATLTYPKPIDTKAPSVMPLWYFDETLGMWKQEGTATLNGGSYTGTVTHFTEWNLDYFDSTGGFSDGVVTLRVVCNSIPISGVLITIVGDDAPGKYFVHPGGRTGTDGTIKFIRFPTNRPTQIDIRSDRNGGMYFINSPINVNLNPGQTLDLGDIVLNSPCPAAIKGSLITCDDSKTEGLVTLTNGPNMSYVYATGDFTLQAAATVPLTLDAMDANGNMATTVDIPALASGELRDIGAIKICGGATSTFIDITTAKSEIGTAAFSPDGSRLASSSSVPTPQVTVYDTKTGNVLSTVSGSLYPNIMEFSADNTKLLVSNYGGGTILYDVSSATGSQILSLPNALAGRLYDDGTKIIGVERQTYPNPSIVNIYSATDGSVIKTLHPMITGNSDSISTFGLIRDEDAIVFPDDAKGLNRVWSVSTDAEIRNFSVAGNSYTFVSSDEGSSVASSADYLTYSCYDTKTGQKTGDIKIGGINGKRYGNPTLTKNNFYVADQVTGADVVRIFKISDGTSTVKLLSGTNYVSSVAASRNEQFLAAVTSGKIRIWQLK